MLSRPMSFCAAAVVLTAQAAFAGVIFSENFESDPDAFSNLARVAAPVTPAGAEGNFVGQVATTSNGTNSGPVALNASVAGVESITFSFITALAEPELVNGITRVNVYFKDSGGATLPRESGDWLYYDGNSHLAFATYSYTMDVPDGAATIDRFEFGLNVGNNQAGATQTFLVDDVEVTANAVPEPASLSLAVVGSLLVLARRRR